MKRVSGDIMMTAYQQYYNVLNKVPVLLPILNESNEPCMNTVRIIERLYCECYQLMCRQEGKVPEDWCLQETMVSWVDNIPNVSNDHELHFFNIKLPLLKAPWKWKVHEVNKCEIKIGLEHNETRNDDYLISIVMATFDSNGFHEVMVDVTWLPDATDAYHNVKWDNAIALVNELLKGHCNWNNITFTTLQLNFCSVTFATYLLFDSHCDPLRYYIDYV
jgi:hypothetical protein